MTFYIQHVGGFFHFLPSLMPTMPWQTQPQQSRCTGQRFPALRSRAEMKSTEQIFWERNATLPCSSAPLLFPPSSTASHQPYPFPLGWHLQLRRETSPRVGIEPPFPRPSLQRCQNTRAEARMMFPAPWAALVDWGGFILTPEKHKGQSNISPQHPAARTTLFCYQVFLMETLFSEILSREIPNFATESQILFTTSFHLDRHNNIVNSRALSTQGMQCLPCSAVYLWLPLKARTASHPHPLRSNHPFENYNQKKRNLKKPESKPILGAREDQSRSTKPLKLL